MRYLALLLVLLAPAALANVPCYGGTVVYAPTLADCPRNISSVSITPMVGGFDLGYTSEGGLMVEVAVEAGHDKKCPDCPYATGTLDVTERRINWNRVNDEAIRDGVGMSLQTQQDASGAGDYVLEVRGLGNSTDYSIHLLAIEIDDGTYAQAWQRNVTTLSTASPSNDPPEWYAGVGGNDLADCRTRATRCATPDPVLAGMQTGDDVALEPGTVWPDYRLVLSTNGSAADLSIWGTNYVFGGLDYWSWEGPNAGLVALAEIQGTWKPACADANPVTCALASASAVPSGVYAGLLDYGIGRQYVVVGGVSVQYSAGRGVDMEGAQHVVFRDSIIGRSAFPNFLAEKSTRYLAVFGNTMDLGSNCEEAEDEGRLSPSYGPYSNCNTSAQPSCLKIATTSHDSYSLAAGNLVSNCAGEAFGTASGSHLWIEQNVTYDTGLSYYIDHMDNTYWLRNLAAGDGNGGHLNQSGFGIAAEPGAVNRGEGQGTHNQLWAWNISVGTVAGFTFRNIGSENIAAGFDVWGKYWHNTAIRTISYAFGAWGSGISVLTNEADVRNNVFWADHSDICRKDTANGTIDYNAWSQDPVPTNCDGANDVVGALTWPHTGAEYTNITLAQATGAWSLSDYKPTGASENAGQVLTVPAWASTDLADSRWDFVRNQISGKGFFMWGDAGCTVEVTAASLLKDGACQALDGTPSLGVVQ